LFRLYFYDGFQLKVGTVFRLDWKVSVIGYTYDIA
jgi:hypothetical protein